MFDRKIFFDSVRASLFSGSLSQQQVNGMNFKLAVWEDHPYSADLRFLAYPFATSFHETAKTMWPIEEYGKGAGMKYGKKDPETGQTYYGRGDVQLTWRENYAKLTKRLNLTGTPDDLEWHAEKALDPAISADVMYIGMVEGLFTGKKLADFFSASKDDPTGARIIINNDVAKNGAMISGYHQKFLTALKAAWEEGAYVPAEPVAPPAGKETVDISIDTSSGVMVSITVNGRTVLAAAW